jgi:hypothetical protein|tara:strand:- start:30 stop:329 length:300 start_codon:yes stop_codon:yes gene_type:complete
MKDSFREDRTHCDVDQIAEPLIASMPVTAVGGDLCSIDHTQVETPRSVGITQPTEGNSAIALLKTPEDGIRFLEECATPYFAVDQQLGCHGNLGEVCHA